MKGFIKILIFVFSIVKCHAELVSVKPSINFKDWSKNIGNCSETPALMWRFESSEWQTFYPNTLDENINCSLKSGFWETFPARRVLIKITTKTTRCSEDNIVKGICKNNLALVVLKNGTTKEEFLIPNTTVDTDFFLYTNELYIDDMQHYEKLSLEFRSERYGGVIKGVQVSYVKCPNATENLVDFDSIPAPSKLENVETITGKCTSNAELKIGDDTPVLKCFYDGTFSVVGNCICNAGYEKKDKKCQACRNGLYKPNAGNDESCQNCGKNTKLGTVPKINCECLEQFHKLLTEANVMDADCYQPPLAPTNLQVTNIQSNSVKLSWTPSIKGSAELGKYTVTCLNCPDSRKEFPIVTDRSEITVSGLGAYAEYRIRIGNHNNITNLTGVTYYNETTFTTKEGAPGVIRDLRFETNKDGDTVVSWNPPFDKGGKDLKYVISYGERELTQKSTQYVIAAGTSKKEYTLKIYVEVVVEGTKYTGQTSSIDIIVNGGIALPVALGIAFGGIIFFVLVLVISFCIWRKRNPAYLQVVRMEDGSVKVPTRFYNSGKIYIDPKSYNQVSDAVNDFAFEIEKTALKTGDQIGEGEFANVFKGELFRDGKHKEVAVKKLKPNASKQDRDDFLSEAAILGQFSDPNVVMLEGVILNEEPNMIVLEFMAHGALDKFLQENDMQFTTGQLLEMARGIASGMKYLSEMGFVHRDLAARNILVNEQSVCKVADFGMSLELNVDESVESKGGKIPVRWTAPEAIQFKKFTTASDVWSYGVVLWEIMSYGERPYWDWNNFEVVEQVNAGYRLPPPMSCPRVVHDLMLSCWNKDRTKRPLFSAIREKIENWLRNPHLLEDLAPVMKLDDNLDYTIMQTINKWLEAIGMGRYASNFIEQGFATPRQILLLTMDDLELLGVGSLEHRKKIHKAIANTRAQVEEQLHRTGSVVRNKRSASFNSMGSEDIAPKEI